MPKMSAFEPGDEMTVELPGGIPMNFRWIPAGEFTMGAPESERSRDEREGPPHPVRITNPFWMAKYPVTQEQWTAVMGKNPSHAKGDDRPVECVSRADCREFLERLNEMPNGGFQMPTEAQWEYACRAGTATRFYWGEDVRESEVDRYAWYDANADERSHPVGQKRANAWGLHDMCGNVWEWCEDSYGEEFYATSPIEDPVNSERGKYRVIRGGAWFSFADNCRSARRSWVTPAVQSVVLGLRCMRPA